MRFGTNKKPFYRIVVMEARSSRQSRPKDFIGNYNPLSDPVSFEIDLDKAKSWLAKGAKPSQTVRSLLERASQRKKLSD
ncbi:MAG TPA: 30S ribosomal protein S16 [Candidatus Desulfaltia sp.]|nr:30S ribosomal protein S16 [Candidatus Desulfaltia sp.]